MRAATKASFLEKPKSRSELKKRVLSRAQGANAPFLELADDLRTFHALARRQDFCALAREAGISERAAYSLIKIAEVFEDYSDRARLEKIGSTKLGAIAANIDQDTTPRTIERWLGFAETHTARECQLFMKREPFAEKTRCMLLRFNEGQYAIFADAMLRHGAKQRGKGLVGIEKALLATIGKSKRAGRG